MSQDISVHKFKRLEMSQLLLLSEGTAEKLPLQIHCAPRITVAFKFNFCLLFR